MDDRSTPFRSARLGRIAIFLTVSIAFSWSQWLAVIASQQAWISVTVPLTPLGAFGPLAGALCAVPRAERAQWFHSITRWRVAPHLTVVACLGIPALFALCLAIATAVTSLVTPLPSWGSIASVAAGMFVLGGGVGEEPGWRGFLLPELARSLTPITSSILVAIAWFTWHLPLFWLEGSSQQYLRVGMFSLGIVAYTFVMTWLWQRSASTLLAMLFHASANTTFWVAMTSIRHRPQEQLFLPRYLGTLAIAGTVAAVAIARPARYVSSPPSSSSPVGS